MRSHPQLVELQNAKPVGAGIFSGCLKRASRLKREAQGKYSFSQLSPSPATVNLAQSSSVRASAGTIVQIGAKIVAVLVQMRQRVRAAGSKCWPVSWRQRQRYLVPLGKVQPGATVAGQGWHVHGTFQPIPGQNSFFRSRRLTRHCTGLPSAAGEFQR